MWKWIRLIAVGIFLGIEAIEDLRSGKISMIWVIIFGIVGLIGAVAEGNITIGTIIGGIGFGIIVCVLSRTTQIGIGEGDGWILMVTGSYLGTVYNILLCYIALLLVALVGGCRMLFQRIIKCQVVKEYPFVPFLFASNIIIGLWRCW